MNIPDPNKIADGIRKREQHALFESILDRLAVQGVTLEDLIQYAQDKHPTTKEQVQRHRTVNARKQKQQLSLEAARKAKLQSAANKRKQT